MAITFVGGDAADDGSAFNTADGAALTLPAHQADDVGYIMAGHSISGSSTTTFDAISGWTSLGTIAWSDGSDGYMELWRRVFTSASETNPTITTVLDSAKCASVMVFRGVDTTTPEDVTVTETDTVSFVTNDLNKANPAITPDNDCGILLMQYMNAQGASNHPTSYGLPATPSGLTLAADGSGSLIGGGNARFIASAYDVDGGSASTAYTPAAWTHSATTTTVQEVAGFTIALRPATASSASDVNFSGTGRGIARGVARGVG